MEQIDAIEAVRRLTLERDALAEQVKRLEAEAVKSGLPPVWEEMRDGCWKHQTDTFTAFVERIDKKFYATAQTAYQTKNHALGFDYFYQAADRCVLLGQQLTGNAPQAPVRHERPETGTEPTEGPNGAPRGCNVPSWGKIARDVIWCASLALQNEIRLADQHKDWDELRRLQKGKMALDRIRDELSNHALVV
jgi:hypothetical protein